MDVSSGQVINDSVPAVLWHQQFQSVLRDKDKGVGFGAAFREEVPWSPV